MNSASLDGVNWLSRREKTTSVKYATEDFMKRWTVSGQVFKTTLADPVSAT